MGLLDKVFKSQRDISKEEITEVPWHPLNEVGQLDEIERASKEQPVAIFKHSTRCGISRMVLKNFESDIEKNGAGSSLLYFLDLLSNRDISSEIAQRFGVQHESPQLLIISNGKVVHHSSHHSINGQQVRETNG